MIYRSGREKKCDYYHSPVEIAMPGEKEFKKHLGKAYEKVFNPMTMVGITM